MRVLNAAPTEDVTKKGIFAWFARNPVAANILIIAVMAGGLFQLFTIKQEVFPEVELDMIVVQIPYPGASPEEVETGVTLVTEEAIRTIDGIKRITSTSGEGFAAIIVELQVGTDATEALNKVRAAVDRITTYPAQAEQPLIFSPTTRGQTLAMVLYGDQPPQVLKQWAERVREDLLQLPEITVVEIEGLPPPELSIEIPQATLRQYRLTLDMVANIIRAASIELPAGRIKSESGEVLLRTSDRRDTAEELAEVVIVAQPDGTEIKLGDLATITDGFADTDQRAYYDGHPGVLINVFRVGEEKPLEVSAAAKAYMDSVKDKLPEGVDLVVFFDASEFYQSRMDLLRDDALQGLILVIIVLGLFLEIRLAFWVTIGIPTSFLGAALFLPPADVSINMISLFAFILALGMVVDDAINIGESVHRYREEGYDRVQAAILGVKEVAVPVTFAITTIMIAYAPMLFIPGVMGKFFRIIPIVVMGVLFISLLESLFILPAHLAHSKQSRGGWMKAIDRAQGKIAAGLDWMIARTYVPIVKAATRRRYLTLAISLSLLLTTCGLVGGGHVKRSFMPEIEGDTVTFEVRLPFGTSPKRAEELEAFMVAQAHAVMDEHGGTDKMARGIYSQIGAQLQGGGPSSGVPDLGAHIVAVMVYMVEMDKRALHATEFGRQWRERVESFPGIESMDVVATTSFGGQKAIDVELSHPDPQTLRDAAARLASELSVFAGVKDVDDGYTDGKPQLDLRLRPEARAAGMTTWELATAVRSAFYGAEALRLQRGRDEVRAYVRLPAAERDTEHGFEEMIIRTPSGSEMPLAAVAEVDRGQSYVEIRRIDGRRAVSVTADVEQAQGNAGEVVGKLTKDVLPALVAEYPQLTWTIGGEQREQEESQRSLGLGMLAAIGVMYALLAIVFRSYVQPLAVLFAIPFGIVGAVIGHIVMGYSISLMSLMGIVALAGVAINDSLVYVDAINRRREAGASPWRAAVEAGAIRCKPIFLTALTSFIGLFPLITETSLQARFLIPMAVSLGFGMIFSTAVTLVVVPCFYLIIEDIKRGLGKAWRLVWGPTTSA